MRTGGSKYAIALALASVALFLGWRRMWFLTDDAFIHFRYVGNSVLGHGYVWNPPPFAPVEGYTSFLWVVLLDAVWRLTGIAPPDAANALSLVCSLLSLFLTAWVVFTFPLNERLARARFGLFVLVLAGLVTDRTFVTWTSSGLETALFDFGVLAWLVAALRLASAPSLPRAALLSASASLIYLTRPEGLLFGAASVAALGLWTLDRRAAPGRLRDLGAALLPLLAIPAHLRWRMSTYGEWLPNTYYAKHAAPWPEAGAHYAASFALEHAVWFWALAFVVLAPGLLARRLAAGRPEQPLRTALCGLAVATVAFNLGYYTFVIGGDTFEYRIYAQLVPLLSLSLLWLLNARGLGPAAALGTLGASVLLSLPIAWLHWRLALEVPPEQASSEDVSVPIAHALPAPLRWYGALFDAEQAWLVEHLVCGRHHSHVHFTAELLATYPERDLEADMPLDDIPVMVQDAIGVAGWSLPQVAILDVHGLTDYVAARTPLAPGQKRQMAHDRRAPREYVEEFRPNVTLGPKGRLRIRPRGEHPLTPEVVVETERRWWEAVRTRP